MTRTATEATSQLTRRKRSLRCLRCDARKFRNPRDLALHILSKHGQVRLPTAASDDARSITLNSPFTSSCDIAELDHLQKTIGKAWDSNTSARMRVRPNSAPIRPSQAKSDSYDSSDSSAPPLRRAVIKRKWSWTTSSCGSSCSGESIRNAQSPRRGIATEHRSDENKPVAPYSEISPMDGESIGPCAKDVYIENCRSGRIPLVPIPSQTPAMMNFADGLF